MLGLSCVRLSLLANPHSLLKVCGVRLCLSMSVWMSVWMHVLRCSLELVLLPLFRVELKARAKVSLDKALQLLSPQYVETWSNSGAP